MGNNHYFAHGCSTVQIKCGLCNNPAGFLSGMLPVVLTVSAGFLHGGHHCSGEDGAPLGTLVSFARA